MRIALGIVAGIVITAACVFVVESVGHAIYPPPPGLDTANPRDMERLIGMLPSGALLFVITAWFIGALAGAITANMIARTAVAGWAVALLVIAAGVATMLRIPHPAWMWAAGIGLPLAAALIAARLGVAHA